MDDFENVRLTHERVGALPVVNWFLERLGLSELLERYVPVTDTRLRLAPARVIELVVRNILLSHEPLYALSEWARPFEPAHSTLSVATSPPSTMTGSVAASTDCLTVTGRACSPSLWCE
jgi:hypothetical protein